MIAACITIQAIMGKACHERGFKSLRRNHGQILAKSTPQNTANKKWMKVPRT